MSKNQFKITTGSESFKNQLVNFFNNYGFNTTVYLKGDNKNVYDVILKWGRFPNYEIKELLYKNLYENSSVSMERKRIKLASLCRNI